MYNGSTWAARMMFRPGFEAALAVLDEMFYRWLFILFLEVVSKPRLWFKGKARADEKAQHTR